jgi:hypothetical protein
MDTNRSIEGQWWFSDDDSVVIPGTLLIGDSHKYTLELNGAFALKTPAQIQAVMSGKTGFISPDTEKTIQGLSKNGKPVTLEYLPIKGSHIVFSGYNSESYPVTRVFENVHFDDPKNITFKKMYVDFSHLYEWFGLTPLRCEYEPHPNGKDIRRMSLICEPQGKIPLANHGNFTLSLITSAHFPFGVTEQIPIKQHTSLIIESTNGAELPYTDFLEIIFSFRELLTLGLGKHATITSIVGFTSVNEIPLPDGTKHGAEVIIHDRFEFPSANEKPLRPDEMHFTFQDIRAIGDTVLGNWINRSQESKDAYNLYFSTVAVPDLNLRNEFLNIISALEGYYRFKYRKDDKLIDVLTALHTNEGKGRIFQGNDFEKIKNSRHKFTHVLPLKGQPLLTDHELYDCTEKLKVMLEICILSEVGLEQAKLDSLIDQKLRHL